MAEKKKDFFLKRWGKAIVRRFVETRQELKRVIWPTKAKLMQVSVVVLAVILAAAILLSGTSKLTNTILEAVGFYKQTTETTVAATAAQTTAAPATVTPAAETTAAATTAETAAGTTAA
jgi:preprotein translocase subunit SecE